MDKSFIIAVGSWLVVTGASHAETVTNLVAAGAELKKLPGEYVFTEGPAVDRDGNVFFTDQPNDRIVKWNAETGTIEDWMKPAGRSNGMFFDGDGNLLACADAENELWSIAPDRKITVLVSGYAGNLLNGPNDLWIRPDGGLYFTDPLYVRPYWKRDKAAQQDGELVYYLPKGGSDPVPVETSLKKPNGIIGSPDGKTLYVADIGANKTYAFAIQPDGSLSNKRLFCAMGSDGMTVDVLGNVYLTGPGVTVYDQDGNRIYHIAVPERWTANVTFGGMERNILFITAGRGIYALQMNVTGSATSGTSSRLKL